MGLALLNPAYFGPFKTGGRGGGAPGGSDLLKNGSTVEFLQKSSIEDPLLVFGSLSSREIAVFLYFGATFAPFVRVPPFENKAVLSLTNLVIPRLNGKFLTMKNGFLRT